MGKVLEKDNSNKKDLCHVCKKYFEPLELHVHVLEKHSKKIIKCKICDEVYASKRSLNDHTRNVHQGERNFKCDICGKSFYKSNKYFAHIKHHTHIDACNICDKSFKDLKHHILHVHEDRKTECGYCGKYFVRKLLKIHIRKEHIISPNHQKITTSLKCGKCEYTTTNKYYLQNHNRRCQKPKSFVCHVCKKCFSDSVKLKKHYECVHAKIKNFKCITCDKYFFTSADLKNHISRIHEKKMIEKLTCKYCENLIIPSSMKRHIQDCHIETRLIYKCDICDQEYVLEPSLKRHYERNHERKRVHCDTCGKQFRWPETLRRHIKSTHGNPDKFPCDSCEKICTTKGNLKSHQQLHSTTRKVFKCPKCSKSLASKSSLNSHIRLIHNKEKSMKCTLCEEKFFHSSALKNHIMSIHEKQKNYKCQECDRAFNVSCNLTAHIRQVHLKDKNIKCNFCEKTFTFPSTLKYHIIRAHENVEKLPCEVCDETFSTKWSLENHTKKFHEGNRFKKCTLCDRVYIQGLNLHMRTFHGKKD